MKVLKSYLTGELHFNFLPDYLSRLEKTKDLDSPIKACPALDAGSGNDGGVDSTVPDYVIPWLACRAVVIIEGGIRESTTYCI